MHCPVCSAEIVDLYPKPRCRACGYVESCCQPELPCPVPATDQTVYEEAETTSSAKAAESV